MSDIPPREPGDLGESSSSPGYSALGEFLRVWVLIAEQLARIHPDAHMDDPCLNCVRWALDGPGHVNAQGAEPCPEHGIPLWDSVSPNSTFLADHLPHTLPQPVASGSGSSSSAVATSAPLVDQGVQVSDDDAIVCPIHGIVHVICPIHGLTTVRIGTPLEIASQSRCAPLIAAPQYDLADTTDGSLTDTDGSLTDTDGSLTDDLSSLTPSLTSTPVLVTVALPDVGDNAAAGPAPHAADDTAATPAGGAQHAAGVPTVVGTPPAIVGAMVAAIAAATNFPLPVPLAPAPTAAAPVAPDVVAPVPVAPAAPGVVAPVAPAVVAPVAPAVVAPAAAAAAPYVAHLAAPSNAEHWYVVTRGRNVGVFDNWAQMVASVSGVSGGTGRGGFPTREAAIAAFRAAETLGIVSGVIATYTLLAACSSPGSGLSALLLSGQSKVSAFEYYTSLARRTENLGVNPPKDRYPAFLIMMREWRHLKLMKRAGRGNDPEGIAATRQGSCAIECPACPLPGKNLPTGWRNVPKSKSWLYRLFLAIDANFRLKRKQVSSDEVDPSLNHGYAYVVEEAAYKAHLAEFDKIKTAPSDHCNNHDAVKSALSRGAVSLASTGVVSVDCGRHEMKRPCATGDLQKGERYVNTDYVLYSTLQHNAPVRVLASYDIGCLFDKNIEPRFIQYGYDISKHEVVWAIPKFHINAHREKCHADYNLRYIPGCACSDCEGIERGWSKSNAAAASTKEMGPGSRRDYFDDIFGFQNWMKVTRLPATLLGKIKKAVPERNAQVANFVQYNRALPLEQRNQWKEAVEAWEEDMSNPNPFFIKRPAITQAAIKRQFTEEDAAALRAGTAQTLHERFSASGMVIAGVELEDQQRRLKADVSGLGLHATDIQRAKMQERQNLLYRRILAWTQIQQLYMPGVPAQRARLLAANEDAAHAHKLPLLMPSAALSLAHPVLLEPEWRLRYAQAFDSLADLRGHLEVRAHLFKFKDRFVRGQRANTRAQTIIKAVNTKIDMDAERYRVAFTALENLAVPLVRADWRDSLKPLLAADIRHVTEAEAGQSEGRRTLSWIWQASASPKGDDVAGKVQDSLQESLRVEWCKARARAARWSEEVELVQEEMRRTIAYHEWVEEEWLARVDSVHVERPDYLEGANAYARRQAATRRSLRDFCEKSWRDVRAWVMLGAPVDDEDSDSVADSLPALESLAASSADDD